MDIDCEAIARANNWDYPKATKYPKIESNNTIYSASTSSASSNSSTSSASTSFYSISLASTSSHSNASTSNSFQRNEATTTSKNYTPLSSKPVVLNEIPSKEEEEDIPIINSIDMNNSCFLDIDCEAIAKENNIEYITPARKVKIETKNDPSTSFTALKKEAKNVPSTSKKNTTNLYRPPVPLWLEKCEEREEDVKENNNIANMSDVTEILTQALVKKCENKRNFVLTQNTNCVKSFQQNNENVEVVQNKKTSSIIVHRKDALKQTSKRNRSSEINFYGLPLEVKAFLLKTKEIEDLYDWQYECLSLPAFLHNRNVIYSLPTSGGKSLVAEVLILREIMIERKNVILLLPFVSIVQEKIQDLMPFAMHYKFLVEEYCAGKGE